MVSIRPIADGRSACLGGSDAAIADIGALTPHHPGRHSGEALRTFLRLRTARFASRYKRLTRL